MIKYVPVKIDDRFINLAIWVKENVPESSICPSVAIVKGPKKKGELVQADDVVPDLTSQITYGMLWGPLLNLDSGLRITFCPTVISGGDDTWIIVTNDNVCHRKTTAIETVIETIKWLKERQ